MDQKYGANMINDFMSRYTQADETGIQYVDNGRKDDTSGGVIFSIQDDGRDKERLTIFPMILDGKAVMQVKQEKL